MHPMMGHSLQNSFLFFKLKVLLYVLFDFGRFLEGLWEALGRDLGGFVKMFSGIWFLRRFILDVFCLIFKKIDEDKHMDF